MNQNRSNSISIQRFGSFYIQHKENENNYFLRNEEISADDSKKLDELENTIFSLQLITFALDGVERNFQELISSIENHETHLNDLGKENLNALPILDVIKGKLSVSQKIDNFLSSTSVFLCRTDKQLQYMYGKNSLEYKAWDKFRKDLHASSFSYKFIYQLRNYSQHRNLPFSKYLVSGKFEPVSNCLIFNADIIVVRDKLLEDGNELWNAPTKAELKIQPSEFDLLPFITEYLQYMRQLCLEALRFKNVQFVELNNYLDAITSENPVDTIPVIYIGESELENFPPPKAKIIPIEEFKCLLKEFNRLLAICEPE